MRIPGRKTAVQITRWLRSCLSNRGLILGYHRIASAPEDFYEICVTPGHFAEHLQILKREFHPMRLGEMVLHLMNGTLPHKSVAITFDDGYADTMTAAKPLLQRYNIPATIFISTGNLGREFWWVELERIIVSPGSLPEALAIPIDGHFFEWKTGNAAIKDASKKADCHRRRLLNALYHRLMPLKATKRAEVINSLKGMIRSELYDHGCSRALNSGEIQNLASDGLIEIGAHTSTHPMLSSLPVAEQEKEIQTNKSCLEDIAGRPVEGFAYPNGSFNQATIALVKNLGFHYACCSRRDVVWRKQQVYQLPRFWPKDWNGERYLKDLELWLN